MNLHIVLPGDAQHERAQCFGQHVHAIDLELDDLLFEQILPALFGGSRITDCRLAGIVTDAERIGAEFEIAENIAAGRVAALPARLAHGAIDVTDDVGMRHTRVLEDHFAVLIKSPAALVEHLADAKARRVARHQEHGRALLERSRRIGPCVDEEQFADRRVGDEALFAVENPFVALAFGAKFQAGFRVVGRWQAVVGAGARLRNPLAEQKAYRRRQRA